MLYLGHFSFHGSHQEGEQQYGFFNCVIEADSVERATELIRVHIQKVKASDDLFDGVDEIYLDEIIEIPEVSSEGLITNYICIHGDMPPLLRCPIENNESTGAECYGWISDEDEHPENEAYEIKPFVEFP